MMDELNRRDVLNRTAGVGLIAALSLGGSAQAQDDPKAKAQEKPQPKDDKERKTDRECVLAAGLTEAEADCWEMAGQLAGKFFDLPEMHPMDKQEVAMAIHVLQYRLLSRPTYRKYKEAHGAPAEPK